MATVVAVAVDVAAPRASDTRLVILASSLGTVFEWYDFFVYGALAALLGELFFPSANPTAALLKSFATFGAGFGVRPLGAILFGRLGDKIGRKTTFLATVTLMGLATAAIGLLPTYGSAGVWAPVLLVTCRCLQGLALGGEYGGAAIYVAEHAPPGRRGYQTSWIQISVVGGFLLSLGVVLAAMGSMSKADWHAWGWRVPFLISLVMLAVSLWIRLKLHESPVYAAMKAKGACAASPLAESFATRANVKTMFVAMIGVAAGLTVIFYTAQFYSFAFLENAMRLDGGEAKRLAGTATVLGAPAFLAAGWLSDRVGRRPVMIAGYALLLVALFPAFHWMARSANPAWARAAAATPVVVEGGRGCAFAVLASGPQGTPCARVLDYLAKRGVSYSKTDGPLGVRVGAVRVGGEDIKALGAALAGAGYPERSAASQIDRVGVVGAILLLVVLSGMTYGPVAAIMVELFPARIRYTSLSIPYHIGTGWFGGFLPFITQYMVAKSGDAFAGLWYTFGVVAVALVVTLLWLPETRGRDVTL